MFARIYKLPYARKGKLPYPPERDGMGWEVRMPRLSYLPKEQILYVDELTQCPSCHLNHTGDFLFLFGMCSFL